MVTEEVEPTPSELRRTITRLEAKIDSMPHSGHQQHVIDSEPSMGEIGRTVLRLEAKIDTVALDHEARLRRAEKWMYALPPTVLTSAGSLAVALYTLKEKTGK